MGLFYIQFDQFLVLSSPAKIKKSTGSLGQDVAIIRTLLEEKGQKNLSKFYPQTWYFWKLVAEQAENLSQKSESYTLYTIFSNN